MRMNGAELTVRLLERQGISIVAGIPGGSNLPIYDALAGSCLRHVLARHEQGAGFIAQGMARVSGRPAVCIGTAGPGVTNLLTAVADAKMDSIPLVAITGQVPLSMAGTDAFQEADTFGLMLPITKHNWLVRSGEELLRVLPEAFRLAMSGRPGPVAIDIPKDVQTAEVVFDRWPDPGEPDPLPPPEPPLVGRMAEMIVAAERPVLFFGGGVVHSEASSALVRFAERTRMPAVSTLMGLGAMPGDHRLFLGMLGMHGSRAARLALEECDLLFAIGVRFDDRATGRLDRFCPQAKVIHVDIDEAELGKLRRPDISVRADAGLTLAALSEALPGIDRPCWRENALGSAPPPSPSGLDGAFNPFEILDLAAGALAGRDVNVATDVGQHQMWTAQRWPFARPRQWLTSGGLGTMGFGLPAAIGAALAQPERMALCVTGDGSLLMNVQELATAAEEGANVKVLVMNNGCLGLVRQQQELFYGARFSASSFRRRTDYAALAEAFGVKGIALSGSKDPESDLRRAFAEPGPVLIDVPISADEMVFPMVPPGGANAEALEGASREAHACV